MYEIEYSRHMTKDCRSLLHVTITAVRLLIINESTGELGKSRKGLRLQICKIWNVNAEYPHLLGH